MLALFKWISLSLPAVVDVGSPQHPDKIDDELGLSIAFRFRHYIMSRLNIENSHLSLHVHSIGLLDAYTLKRCFQAWNGRVQTMHERRRRMAYSSMRVAMRKLHTFLELKNRPGRFYNLTQLSPSFDRKRLANAILLWSSDNTRLKLEQFLCVQGEDHWFHRNGVSALERWCMHIVQVRSQKQLSYSSFQDYDYRLTSFFLESGMKTLYRNLSNARSRKMYDSSAREHYSFFHASSTLNKWLKKCGIKGYPLIKQNNVTIIRREMVFQHCNNLTSKQMSMHYVLRIWKKRSRKLHSLEGIANKIYKNRWSNLVSKSFGSWFMIFAYKYRLSKCCKSIQHKYFIENRWRAWFVWKSAVERSILLRNNKRDILEEKNKEFAEMLERNSHSGLSKKSLLRIYAKSTRINTLCLNLTRAVYKVLRRHGTMYALAKWRLVHAEGLVASCLQKHWRGYAVRGIHYPNRVVYINHFRENIHMKLRNHLRLKYKRMIFEILHKFIYAEHIKLRKRLNSKCQRRILSSMYCYALRRSRDHKKIVSCDFHFQLMIYFRFLNSLRVKFIDKMKLRSVDDIRRVTAIRNTLGTLCYNVHVDRCFRIACRISNNKIKKKTISRVCFYRKWKLYRHHVDKRCDALILTKAWGSFQSGVENRMLQASFKKDVIQRYLTSKVLKWREFAVLRRVLRKVSNYFRLKYRVNELLHRFMFFVKLRRHDTYSLQKAARCNEQFQKKNTFVTLNYKRDCKNHSRKLDSIAHSQHRRFWLRCVVRSLRNHSNLQILDKRMSTGTSKEVKIAINRISQVSGIRSQYIIIVPACVKSEYLHKLSKVRAFWNKRFRDFSLSRDLFADDSEFRRNVLRGVIVRSAVRKMRVCKLWYWHIILQKKLRNLSDKICKKKYSKNTNEAMHRLYINALTRSRHRSRVSKRLRDSFEDYYRKEFMYLRNHARIEIMKRKFLVVRRLRKNLLIAIRYIYKRLVLHRKITKVFSLIQLKKMRYAHYALSKQKELRITLRNINEIGKRAHNKYLKKSFFRLLRPVIKEKKKLNWITRRIYLRHYMHSWYNTASTQLGIFQMQLRSNRNRLLSVFEQWRLYTERYSRIRLTSNEVFRRHVHYSRISTMCEWLDAVYNTRLQSKFEIVKRSDTLSKKLFVLKHWQHSIVANDVALWRDGKFAFNVMLARSKQSIQQAKDIDMGDLHYNWRSCVLVLRQLNMRVKSKKNMNDRISDINAVIMLRRCVQKLKYWHVRSQSFVFARKRAISSLINQDVVHVHYFEPLTKKKIRVFSKYAGISSFKTSEMRSMTIAETLSLHLQIRLKSSVSRNLFRHWIKHTKACIHGRHISFVQSFFKSWNTIIKQKTRKRSALIERLNLIIRKDSLSRCFIGFIRNTKANQFSRISSKYTLKKSFQSWIDARNKRIKTKRLSLLVNKSMTYQSIRNFFILWKVSTGPARRFECTFYYENVFNRWYNLTLSRSHYRRTICHNVIKRWHALFFQRGRARLEVRQGRHLVMVLITKLKQQRYCLLQEAFYHWNDAPQNKNRNDFNKTFYMNTNTPGSKSKIIRNDESLHSSSRQQHKVTSTVDMKSWHDNVEELRQAKSTRSLKSVAFKNSSINYKNLSLSQSILKETAAVFDDQNSKSHSRRSKAQHIEKGEEGDISSEKQKLSLFELM